MTRVEQLLSDIRALLEYTNKGEGGLADLLAELKLKADLTETQPVSATSLPLPTGASTAVLQTTGNTSLSSIDTRLTDGTQKSVVRGGAKGITIPADVTSTAQSADRQALDVQIRTSTGAVVDSFGGGGGSGTQYNDGDARGTATGTLVMGDDGVSIQSIKVDTNGVVAIQDNGDSITIDNTAITSIDDKIITDDDDGIVSADQTVPLTMAVLYAEGDGANVRLSTDYTPERRLKVQLDSVPLAPDAATETTLSAINTKTPALGQTVMANSTPVTIASNQTALPVTDNGGSLTVDTPQLPAALVGGRLDSNIGSWLGSTTPTVGQKDEVSSIPVTTAQNQTGQSVEFGNTQSTTTVVGSAISVLIKAASTTRKEIIIRNDTNKKMFICFFTPATTATPIFLNKDEIWVEDRWQGAIYAIWETGVTGNSYITEVYE